MFVNTSPINPLHEILAYESLWSAKNATFKSIAQMFAKSPGSRPSDFVQHSKIENFDEIKAIILDSKKYWNMHFLIHGTIDFPARLRDAKEPLELLYYSGNLDYLAGNGVAIVGTRNPTTEGLGVTKEIATKLVQDGFTIVSGLAMGIDTQAHVSAIEAAGKTIAVIGTPLNTVYPRQNEELQKIIAKEHLLVSQVPFFRYTRQDYRMNRLFFPERNKTMSALTDATFIVEAGETSGSLTQAVAAIHQKRKLFIWDACFYNKAITWPKKFEDLGATRVKNYEDIKKVLNENV